MTLGIPDDVRSSGDGPRWDSLAAPRLVFPFTFKDDESLMGGIYRAAADCIMGSTHQVLTAMGAPHAHWYFLAWLEVDADRIAHVLRTDPAEVTRRLYRPIDQERRRTSSLFFGATIMPSDLLHRPRLVAPRALAHSAHQRAIWAHELLPFSHETGEFLISSCPRCATALGWATCEAVEACHSCGFDLREHRAVRIDAETMETVGPVARLLDPVPAVREPAMSMLPEPLQLANPGDAFEFIWRLGAAFVPGSPVRQRVCRLTADEKVRTLKTGADLLVNWPEAVLARLRQDAITDTDAARTTSVKLATMAHNKPIVPECHRLMIRQISDNVKLGPQTFLKAAVRGAMGNAETARHLGTTEKIVKAMRDRRALPGVHIGGVKNKFALHEATDLEGIKALLADAVPITNVSQRLGITRNGAEQIDATGMLGSLPGDELSGIYKTPRVSHSAVEVLLADLDSRSRLLGSQEETLPLGIALRAIGGREKPWGPLVKLMREGEIAFQLSPAKPEWLPAALVRQRDVAHLVALRFEECAYECYAFHDVIPCIDAIAVLNVSFALLERFLASPGAPKRVAGRQLPRPAVLSLAREIIGVAEVTARWGNNRKRWPAFFGTRDFDRLNVLGWPRLQVEALAKMSGVSG